jgi:hypothetical protein
MSTTTNSKEAAPLPSKEGLQNDDDNNDDDDDDDDDDDFVPEEENEEDELVVEDREEDIEKNTTERSAATPSRKKRKKFTSIPSSQEGWTTMKLRRRGLQLSDSEVNSTRSCLRSVEPHNDKSPRDHSSPHGNASDLATQMSPHTQPPVQSLSPPSSSAATSTKQSLSDNTTALPSAPQTNDTKKRKFEELWALMNRPVQKKKTERRTVLPWGVGDVVASKGTPSPPPSSPSSLPQSPPPAVSSSSLTPSSIAQTQLPDFSSPGSTSPSPSAADCTQQEQHSVAATSPPECSPTPSAVSPQSTQPNSGSSSEEKATAKKTVKIVETYRFVDEEMRIEKEVPIEEVAKKTKGTRGSSLDRILSKVSNKKKLSTLQKSSYDWNKYKAEEGLEAELEQHKKDSYLERVSFLTRTDWREFEREREVRERARKAQKKAQFQ